LFTNTDAIDVIKKLQQQKPKSSTKSCFAPDTLIMMKDNTSRPIQDIRIGDETKGGKVTGVMTFDAEDAEMFLVDGRAQVSALHAVLNTDGTWSRVFNSPRAVPLDEQVRQNIRLLFNFDCTSHLIFVEGVDLPFGDFSETPASEKEIEMWDAALNNKI